MGQRIVKYKINGIEDIWGKKTNGIWRSDKKGYRVGEFSIFAAGINGIWDIEHRQIPDFSSKSGSYLGVAESMGHVPKMLQFENWNRTENRYTRNTSNAAK